jgi:hypothetical protein
MKQEMSLKYHPNKNLLLEIELIKNCLKKIKLLFIFLILIFTKDLISSIIEIIKNIYIYIYKHDFEFTFGKVTTFFC